MNTHHSPTSEMLTILAGYNSANNNPTWVIHTPPESTIGGFSARFISFETPGSDNVVIQWANGDIFIAPLSEITIRVAL